MQGQLELWGGEKCAAVTEVTQTPRIKIFHFFLLGGNMEELLEEMYPKLLKVALQQGCRRVTGVGREGWGRVLSEKGFEKGGTMMYRDLF